MKKYNHNQAHIGKLINYAIKELLKKKNLCINFQIHFLGGFVITPIGVTL